MTNHQCSWHNCTKPAECVAGIELYAPNGKFITKLITSLHVCREHLPTREEMPLEAYEPVVETIERTYCALVDRNNHKIIGVEFTESGYIALINSATGKGNASLH